MQQHAAMRSYTQPAQNFLDLLGSGVPRAELYGRRAESLRKEGPCTNTRIKTRVAKNYDKRIEINQFEYRIYPIYKINIYFN